MEKGKITLLKILIIIFVVILIGVSGLYVYKTNEEKKNPDTPPSSIKTSDISDTNTDESNIITDEITDNTNTVSEQNGTNNEIKLYL